MVFPTLSFTLRDVLKDHSLSPLPAQHVQEISFQLVNAVRRKLFRLCCLTIFSHFTDYY